MTLTFTINGFVETLEKFIINAFSSTRCFIISQGTKNYIYQEGILYAWMKEKLLSSISIFKHILRNHCQLDHWFKKFEIIFE